MKDVDVDRVAAYVRCMYVFVCICACVRFVYTRRKSSWRCKRRKHCWVCTWKLAIIIVIKGERRSRRRPLNINLAPQRARAGRKLNTHTHTQTHNCSAALSQQTIFCTSLRSANTRSFLDDVDVAVVTVFCTNFQRFFLPRSSSLLFLFQAVCVRAFILLHIPHICFV